MHYVVIYTRDRAYAVKTYSCEDAVKALQLHPLSVVRVISHQTSDVMDPIAHPVDPADPIAAVTPRFKEYCEAALEELCATGSTGMPYVSTADVREPARLIVVMKKGVVTHVYGDGMVDLTVFDFDVQGGDEGDMYHLPASHTETDERCYVNNHGIRINAGYVVDVLRRYNDQFETKQEAFIDSLATAHG
jgi:hypothetical protein